MRDVNIKITPFELLDIVEYTGVKKENEHGYVKFSGHICADLEDTYVQMALSELWTEISVVDGAEEKIVFCGVVTSLKIITSNQVKLLTVELKSGSYLMDIKTHIRSYQNQNIAYKTVLSSFTDEYQDGNFIMTKGNGFTIPPLVLQYQETDWEFTKRLATHFKTIVVPNCKTKGVKYFFGLPQLGDAPEINTHFYGMEKRTEEFIWKKKNGVSGIRERDAIYYTITSRDVYDLGSPISLNGETLYVSEIDSTLEGAELYHTYYLKSENGFQVPKQYNLKVIGAALYANIRAVERDVVQISIEKDENKKNAGVNWYPYSTVYSTPDGTGWYCMPEIGDAVRIYIPNADEAEAYIISSTHLESSASDERRNPDYKSIMNKYHKEVLFTPDSITITNNAGMSIEILDDKGIRIISNKSILIKSKAAIEISSATSNLQIIAPNSILLQQGDSKMLLKDHVTLTGSQVQMD